MTQPAQKPGVSKQDYATPDNFIAAVKGYLHIQEFMFDFAADASNAKALRWWDERSDALSMPAPEWAMKCTGGWGWLNPPFAKIGPWAKRCVETSAAGGQVAFLVPAGVGANWFRDFVYKRALVLALNGRLAFMPDQPTWLYPKDCILCLFGPTIAPGFDVWAWRT